MKLLANLHHIKHSQQRPAGWRASPNTARYLLCPLESNLNFRFSQRQDHMNLVHAAGENHTGLSR